MTTEKEKMAMVDGKGRSFEVIANTENDERDMGNTRFEDLLPGDLFVSFDGLELNVCSGSFVYLVLESPHMVDNVPTLKVQAINLQQISLIARPLEKGGEENE